MSTKIFVGRIGWKTGRDALANYFSRFGQVTDAKIVSDRATGRSKGFGFVTFADAAGAQQAISHQGHEVDGRTVVVNQAAERNLPNFDFKNKDSNTEQKE
eukprot:TRINITY_DN19675_c0_g1_i1.p1 TRINITY_DN19675_c0_g1~~TRINITY_DN19675_c0_g1_i1.p1  ORF type:complete len:100 (+),score=33.78 TRINITY_DN19675_c0_g1_i1:32-331(+)